MGNQEARGPRVSNSLVRALLEVVHRRGVDPEVLLGAAKHSALAEPPDTQIPLAEYQQLLARGSELATEPGLGIYTALLASESSYGVITPLVAHAPSLRRGLELMSQFHELLFDAVRLELSEQAGAARLVCSFQVTVDRSVIEFMLAGLVRTLRSFGCDGEEILAVCFAHRRPAHARAYATAFEGRERFSQAFNGVEFKVGALDRPHLHRHPQLQALLRAEAENALNNLSRPLSTTERVRALLQGRPNQPPPNMDRVARTLRLSVRSLRRRLEEEGTTFTSVLHQVQHESACTLLRNPELGLKSIAYRLGFASAPGFHRAFKRWTGLTPEAYRVGATRPSDATG